MGQKRRSGRLAGAAAVPPRPDPSRRRRRGNRMNGIGRQTFIAGLCACVFAAGEAPSADQTARDRGPCGQISSFATVRHRTVRSKGCLSNKTALAMIFKLAEAAEKSWRRLDGHNQLPKIILGVKFTDGIEVIRSQAQAAAA
jgi:hypothetical protein